MANTTVTIQRLAAYSDGIIAVVATLLVLGINVPEGHEFSTEGLLSFLEKMRHDIRVYGLSFLIITSYWLQHHTIFLFLRHANRALSWLNLVFLFWVTLIPFAAKLVAVYHSDYLVLFLYGLLQVACGTMLVILWLYAYRHPHLWEMNIDPGTARSLTLRILLGPLFNLVAVGVSTFSVSAALTLFVLAPLLQLSHRRVDSRLHEMIVQRQRVDGSRPE